MKQITVLMLMLFATVSLMAQVADNPKDVCPILVGEKLPDAKLINLENKEIRLDSLLKEKPTVIVIYRGGWCPFCNMQLSGLAQIQDEIAELGYQIIAITPDDVNNLKDTENKETFKYQLFSDPNADFIQRIGVAFKTDIKTKGYSRLTGSNISDILPVPTVMVVNQEGEILFEYINPNYRKRLNEKMLLSVLQNIEK